MYATTLVSEQRCITCKIQARYDSLARHLFLCLDPPVRLIWMSEDSEGMCTVQGEDDLMLQLTYV